MISHLLKNSNFYFIYIFIIFNNKKQIKKINLLNYEILFNNLITVNIYINYFKILIYKMLIIFLSFITFSNNNKITFYYLILLLVLLL